MSYKRTKRLKRRENRRLVSISRIKAYTNTTSLASELLWLVASTVVPGSPADSEING